MLLSENIRAWYSMRAMPQLLIKKFALKLERETGLPEWWSDTSENILLHKSNEHTGNNRLN